MLLKKQTSSQGVLHQQILSGLDQRHFEESSVAASGSFEALEYALCGTVNGIMSILGSLSVQFNQRMPKPMRMNVFAPSFGRQTILAEGKHLVRNSYRGQISVKNWTLTVRTNGTKIEFILTPTTLVSCRAKQESHFYLVLHAVSQDGLISWIYQDQLIQPDGLRFPCRAAFQALVRAAFEPSSLKKQPAPTTARAHQPVRVQSYAQLASKPAKTADFEKVDALLSKMARCSNPLFDQIPAEVGLAKETITALAPNATPAPAHQPVFPSLAAYRRADQAGTQRLEMLNANWNEYCQVEQLITACTGMAE